MTEQSGTRRILIADDEPERLKALVDRLQREGFSVLSAQDGLEALDRAREELPDAIILNILLRRIDGLRVCEILKSNPATTNIPVLLTAGVHVDADEGQRALAAGADRFLSDLSPLSTGTGRELGAGQDRVPPVRMLLGAEPELELRPILLAIDDDPDNRAFLTKAVTRQGFEVVTAPNATQARRQLDGRRPALIFLDVQMPEESGLTLLPQMLRDFPEAVVVMMTAYGSEQVAAEALRGGADDYIAKPIDQQWPAPARADQRHPRPGEDRGGQDGAARRRDDRQGRDPGSHGHPRPDGPPAGAAGDDGRRRRSWGDQGGPQQVQAGALQPALQRGEIHAAARPDHPHGEGLA